jgi:hypothetical protein
MEKRRLGSGAAVRILLKYLHPKLKVQECFPNAPANQRLEEFRVLRLGTKVISRVERVVVFVTHDVFQNNEMYCAIRYAHVTEEGPEASLFATNDAGNVILFPESHGNENEEVLEVLPEELVRENIHFDNPGTMAVVHEHDLSIDDDNAPAPENIPQANDDPNTVVFRSEWGHDGICFRRNNGANNQTARLVHLKEGMRLSHLQMFEMLFPTTFVKNVMLPAMNAKIRKQVEYGEFLQYIGIMLKISTTAGHSTRDFWKLDQSGTRETPFRFNDVMSRDRFDEITQNLTYTNKEPPPYKDRFWQIRDVIQAWNDNMADEFQAGWITVLDESMSKWVNKYTCPGFMVVPRKPWPLGNEYHSIVCSQSDVMFAIELVEGKDVPSHRDHPRFEHHEKGKTVSKLIRLTKSLQGRGSIVVLDSGFCVLKGIIELKKVGIHAAALIKKRRYWPKHIDGQKILEYFQDKEIGFSNALKGKMEDVDFYIHCVKEPDYVLMFMTSYGLPSGHGHTQKRKTNDGRMITFQYPEVAANHYKFRDGVDNHNARRMYPVAIEEQMRTMRWENRVFQFLLAVTEVNTNAALHYFQGDDIDSQLDFRYKLASEMINNEYVTSNSDNDGRRLKRKDKVVVHDLRSVPPYKKFRGTELVAAAGRYNQRLCSLCGSNQKKIRTYCICTPGTFRCRNCYDEHIIECNNEFASTC